MSKKLEIQMFFKKEKWKDYEDKNQTKKVFG